MKIIPNIVILISLLLFFDFSLYGESVENKDPFQQERDSIGSLCRGGDLDSAKNLLEHLRTKVEDNPSENGTQILYQCWGNIVAYHFNRNEIIESVEEVRKMQDYASECNDPLGMAFVDQTYGGLYTYNFEESIRHLNRALEYWDKTDNKSQKQYTYYMLSREALGMAESSDSIELQHELYAQVLDYADRIEDIAIAQATESFQSTNDNTKLTQDNSTSPKNHPTSSNTEDKIALTPSALYNVQISEFLRMMVYLADNDQSKARESYQRMSKWWDQDQADPRIKGMMAYVMADYLISYSNPELASALIPQINIERQRLEMEKKLCQAQGDFKRAIELQKKLDKLNLQRTNQLQQTHLAIANAGYNNLRLEREKHQLEMESAQRSMMLKVVVVIALALVILIVAMIISHRRVLRKNRELVRRIEAQEEQHAKTQKLTMTMRDSLSQEQQLFLQIEQLLEQDTELLTDASLNRDTLASRLNTNRTYIAQAIAACADGMSVSEYVNRLRLQHARRLLSDNPDMSIDQVAAVSGFGSRSRFHHLFVEHYGMTPVQFRNASKG